jgi:hypothetical protein
MLKRTAFVLSLILACGIAGFLGGLLAYLYHPIPPPTTTDSIVTARRFRVMDQHGRVAAELSDRGLDLLGQDGRVRATLRLAYNDKGVLGFSDGKWEGRMLLGFLGTDTPSDSDDDWGLVIHGPEMGMLAYLATTGQGKAGVLGITNEKGKQILVPAR